MAKYDKFTSPKNPDRPVQVESAIRDGAGKNIENNYAKQNGYYAGLSAGHADSTEAIDTTIGVDEHSLKTFGTNGGDADIQTGQQELKSLSGVTIIKNQYCKPLNSINWRSYDPESYIITFNNGTASISYEAGTEHYGEDIISQYDINFIGGHKYLVSFKIKNASTGLALYIRSKDDDKMFAVAGYPTAGDSNIITFITTESNKTGSGRIALGIYETAASNISFDLSDFYLIDLTQMFGNNDVVNAIIGDGTQQEKYQNLLDFFGGWLPTEYDEGTPLPAKPFKLKTVDYNLFDEDLGKNFFINASTGVKGSGNYCGSNHKIRVEGNVEYGLIFPSTNASTIFIYEYDINGNYVDVIHSGDVSNQLYIFTTNENCAYIEFCKSQSTYGTTYKNDICLFAYWDGSRIGYEPYSDHEYELPNIELNGILKVVDGEVVNDGDIIYPDEQNGKKRYKKITITSMSGGYVDQYAYRGQIYIDDIIPTNNVWDDCNKSILPAKWTINTSVVGSMQTFNPTVPSLSRYYNGDKNIYFCAPGCTTNEQLAAYLLEHPIELIYELAEEQDLESTPFPGNIYMDDFGTFEFLDENDAQQPGLQPANIFYTANIAGFAETLYGKVNGNADKIAEVDGEYDAMSVGHANSAASLDTGLGIDDETPFSYQTAGGESDLETGMQELKKLSGAKIVWNQLVGNMPDYTHNGLTLTNNSDGTLNIQGTAAASISEDYNQFTFASAGSWTLKPNHIYFAYKNKEIPCSWGFTGFGKVSGSTFGYFLEYHLEFGLGLCILAYEGDVIDISGLKGYIIDLTQMFGNNNVVNAILGSGTDEQKYNNLIKFLGGKLPTEENKGELVGSKSAKIKMVDYNQWDEQWKNGYYDTVGIFNPNSNYVASKNPIRVLPSTAYYFTNTYIGRMCFYDKNMKFISTIMSRSFTTPINAYFMNFDMTSDYGNTYNNDICIFLYWDGSRIGYEPYAEHIYQLPNVDLNGILKVVDGSIVADGDEIYPDGTGKKRYCVVDLGTLDWNWESGNTRFNATLPYTAGGPVHPYFTWIFNNVLITNDFDNKGNQDDKSFFIYADGTYKLIYMCDSRYAGDASSLKAALNGVMLIYELGDEEDTTQAGFPENIYVDDFGTMQFLDEDDEQIVGLQGCEVFYKANIAGFAESLYDRADGSPENVVIQTELSAETSARTSTDSALQEAIGGTLRQCLCVKESLDFNNTAYVDLGSGTWIYNGNNIFYSFILDHIATTNPKCLCSAYQNSSHSWDEQEDKSFSAVTGGGNNYVIIKDTSYSDATAFKNAMKGVLLAYEKAE